MFFLQKSGPSFFEPHENTCTSISVKINTRTVFLSSKRLRTQHGLCLSYLILLAKNKLKYLSLFTMKTENTQVYKNNTLAKPRTHLDCALVGPQAEVGMSYRESLVTVIFLWS